MKQCKDVYILTDKSKFGEVRSVTFGGFTDAKILTEEIPEEYQAVSYTHLDVYKRQLVISSLILAACVAAILIGGLKRIATVSQIIVPFMAVIYLIFSVALILRCV